MLKEHKAMKTFDTWVKAFVSHVEGKGALPDVKDAERSAETTTNQDAKRI